MQTKNSIWKNETNEANNTISRIAIKIKKCIKRIGKWIGKILKQDYFNWKSHKFNVTESQARRNSVFIDKLSKEINEENKSEKLKTLKEEIEKQYKDVVGEDLNLTERQLLTIIDAHKKKWILWQLTDSQLRGKAKELSKTITNEDVRRFLLEAGFCGFLDTIKKMAWIKEKENLKYNVGDIVQVCINGHRHTAEIVRFNPKTKKYALNDVYLGELIATEKNITSADDEIYNRGDRVFLRNIWINGKIKWFKDGSYIVEANDGTIYTVKPNYIGNASEDNENNEEYEIEPIIVNVDEEEFNAESYINKNELNNDKSNRLESNHKRNTERRERNEVPRESDVVAVWDLHGEYRALKWNLEYAWLARENNNGHLEWIGWDKKVVFQWDILGDRWTDWLRIIEEIHNLREQAKAQWWDIDIIVWNHDDFLISYLIWEWAHLNWLQQSELFEKWYGWPSDRPPQWKWLIELLKFLWITPTETIKDYNNLRDNRIKILKRMRDDPKWRLILEEICNMKLVSQVDDVLYCHTNPTSFMMEILTKWKYKWNITYKDKYWRVKLYKEDINLSIPWWNTNIQNNIDILNEAYQWFLKKTLLWKNIDTVSQDDFKQMCDIFLFTENRYTGIDENTANKLRNSWINMISHGHNGWSERDWYINNQKKIWWIIVVDTDTSYWKFWDERHLNKPHSLLKINKNGWDYSIWDKANENGKDGINDDSDVIVSVVEGPQQKYANWTEVYLIDEQWLQRKVKIQDFDPDDGRYSILDPKNPLVIEYALDYQLSPIE